MISDSDAAENLETEKKTARNKTDNRRKKFQAQDSVLNETFNASQAWSEIPKFPKILTYIFTSRMLENEDYDLPGMTWYEKNVLGCFRARFFLKKSIA